MSSYTNSCKTTSFTYDETRSVTRKTNSDLTFEEIDPVFSQAVVNLALGVGTLANPASLINSDNIQGSMKNERRAIVLRV